MGLEGLDPMKSEFGRTDQPESKIDAGFEKDLSRLRAYTGKESAEQKRIRDSALGLSAEKLSVLGNALNTEGVNFGYFINVRDVDAVEEILVRFATSSASDERKIAKEIAGLIAD